MEVGCNDVDTIQLVRLHVSAGTVWYGYDGVMIQRSGHSIDEFVSRSALLGVPLDRVHVIRLLGSSENADLIVKLHERRMACALEQKIEIGSPAMLPVSRDRNDPRKVLRCLLQPEASALACGGIHDMTAWDYSSYSLVAASRAGMTERASKTLPYHPAWPAISFLPCYSVPAAVKLLTAIVDPRWYRHPCRPHRTSKLLSYLGVTPDNIRAVVSGGRRGACDLLSSVVESWYTAASVNVSAPCNFLGRVFLSAADPVVGMMRACRRFVRFIYEVWLGEAVCQREECRFSPETFFLHESECKAYTSHRKSLCM